MKSVPCCAAVLLALATSVQATPYVFVTRHTQGVVRWNHLGFSNPSAQLNGITGTLDWNAGTPAQSSVKATIPMSGIATGVPDLDEHFNTADFFDSAHFAQATFASTHVEAGAMPGTLKVTGDLALHGVTKPVTLDVTINGSGKNPRNGLGTVGFEAVAVIKRSDFSLGRFVPQVSDDIRLALTVEAVDAAENEALEKAEAAKEEAEKKDAAKNAEAVKH